MPTPMLPLPCTASIEDVLRTELAALQALEMISQLIREGREKRDAAVTAGNPLPVFTVPTARQSYCFQAFKDFDAVLLAGPMSAVVGPASGEWIKELRSSAGQGARALEWLVVLTERALMLLGANWPTLRLKSLRLRGRKGLTYPKALPENGIAALASAQLWALLESSTHLCRTANTNGSTIYAEIATTAKAVNSAMADTGLTAAVTFRDIETRLSVFDPLDPQVMFSLTEVRKALTARSSDVKAWTEQQKLIVVSTKRGKRYPSFQFDFSSRETGLNKRYESIRILLDGLNAGNLTVNQAGRLTGWPLALWAHANLDQDAEFFEKELSPIGLWKKTDSKPVIGPRKKTDSKPAAVQIVTGAIDGKALACRSMPDIVYRVTKGSYDSPYHFSTGTSRYDLTGIDGVGTMYVGRTALGCWAEVLDREPVVTLDMLSQKRLWMIRLALAEQLRTLDLTQFGDRLINAPRQESQAIAQHVQHSSYDGVEYSLRSIVSQTGIALFGPTNVRELIGADKPVALPNRPPIFEDAHWITERTDCLNDRDLWDHLISRRPPGSRAALLLLRSFPDWPDN